MTSNLENLKIIDLNTKTHLQIEEELYELDDQLKEVKDGLERFRVERKFGNWNYHKFLPSYLGNSFLRNYTIIKNVENYGVTKRFTHSGKSAIWRVFGGNLNIFGRQESFTSKKTDMVLYRSPHGFRKNILLPIVFSKAYLHTIVEDDTLISRVRRLAIRFLDFYEKGLEFLLGIPGMRQLIIGYIYFISLVRWCGFKLGESMDLPTLNLYILVVVSFLHKFGLGWYVITGCLLFLAMDSQGIFVAKFYKKRPALFNLHFGPSSGPGSSGGLPPRRSMFSAAKALATKIATEAASNPVTVGVGTAVVGGITWKLLDIHDTNKQEALQNQQIAADATAQEKQIEADNRRHMETLEAEARERQKDRDAENKRHMETLEADNRRHMETLEAEARERQKDRDAAAETLERS